MQTGFLDTGLSITVAGTGLKDTGAIRGKTGAGRAELWVGEAPSEPGLPA
jgi:hypothetical protein